MRENLLSLVSGSQRRQEQTNALLDIVTITIVISIITIISHYFKMPRIWHFYIFIDYAITVVPFPPLHSTPSCPPPPSHIPTL